MSRGIPARDFTILPPLKKRKKREKKKKKCPPVSE